jgi:hypothetical protein
MVTPGSILREPTASRAQAIALRSVLKGKAANERLVAHPPRPQDLNGQFGSWARRPVGDCARDGDAGTTGHLTAIAVNSADPPVDRALLAPLEAPPAEGPADRSARLRERRERQCFDLPDSEHQRSRRAGPHRGGVCVREAAEAWSEFEALKCANRLVKLSLAAGADARAHSRL